VDIDVSESESDAENEDGDVSDSMNVVGNTTHRLCELQASNVIVSFLACCNAFLDQELQLTYRDVNKGFELQTLLRLTL